MAEIVIKLFGEPEVTRNGKKIRLGSSLPLLMILVLMSHRDHIPVEEVVALLHPDGADAMEMGDAGKEPKGGSFVRKSRSSLLDKLGEDTSKPWSLDDVVKNVVKPAHVDVLEFDAGVISSELAQVQESVQLRLRGPLGEPAVMTAGLMSFLEEQRQAREKLYWSALRQRLIPADQPNRPKQALHWVNLLLDVPNLSPNKIDDLTRLRQELEGTSPPHPQSLPLAQSLPEIIGRSMEINAIQQQLQTPGLVTLTGIAGIGKTRLALAVAGQPNKEIVDSIQFIDLTAVTDASLLPLVVGQGLGLREEKGYAWQAMVLAHLKDKAMLLVLDNCEHLAKACNNLAHEIINSCPSMRLLVTSREPLGVSGERVYPVPPLPLPTSGELVTPADVLECPATRLFVERAQAAKPGFCATAENCPSIFQICHGLDGLPLAIELAAALVDEKEPDWIAERLDKCFGLLVDGERAGSLRHPSLRAAFDLSYGLLSRYEQKLFRHLGVFVGNFDTEAVKAVLVSAPDVVELVPRLVRKSLVMEDPSGEGMRYRLLVTTRQYAQDRLLEREEEAEANYRHRGFYLHLAEETEPQLRGPAPKRWLDRLEVEVGNLRAALYWRADEEALCLACALQRFWQMRGYFHEGRHWLERDIQAPGNGSEAIRARASAGAGALANLQGEFQEAHRLYETSLTLCLRFDDDYKVAAALCALGDTAILQGDYDEAEIKYGESQQLYAKADDQSGLSDVLYGFGKIAYNQCHYLEARKKFEVCLILRRTEGDSLKISEVAVTLGRLFVYQGQYQEARALLEECLALQRQIGNAQRTALALLSLGELARFDGKEGEAKAFYEESLALTQQVGDRWNSAMCLNTLGLLAFELKEFEVAGQRLEQSLALFQEVGNKQACVGTLVSLAAVSRSLGDFAQALRLSQESLTETWGLQQWPWIACTIEELGLLAAEMGHNRRGVTLLGAAKEFLAETKYPQTAHDRERSSQSISRMHEGLGAEAFTESWAEGQAMT